jgi:DeoR/GlpR family transcriptional regulator of sugar metabolism
LSPSTDRMLNRVKSVYLFIRRQGTVSTKELVEEFDMTQRTMQRDLTILTYNDLVRSPQRGQWTVTEKKVRVS